MAGAAKLTAKQERFVAEYLIDLNATQAAIRAGYSAKTAGAVGHENLKKPEIATLLQEAMQKRQRGLELTAERVLLEVARLAFFDPRKLLREDGSPKPIHELDDDTAAAVAGLDITEEWEGTGEDRVFIGYTKKYKFADKNAALDKAMRHLGLGKTALELTGKDGKDLLPAPTGVLVVPGAMSADEWEAMMAKQEAGE